MNEGLIEQQPYARQAPLAAALAEHPEELPDPELIPQTRATPVQDTGSSGLVVTHTCRELARRGWKIRALVRNPEKAAGRLAGLPVEIVTADLRDRDALSAVLPGVAAVVHLAAIAIEQRGQSYEDVNTAATAMLLDIAQHAGVDRFVHMSQNGASSDSPSRFLRSKGIAEDRVRESPLAWTVLRPSVIVGPEDEFVNVLARLVRLTPIIFPLPGGGRSRFQPIAVRDVAQAVSIALDRPTTIRGVYGIGGPAALTLREMTERILTAMRARRVIVGVSVSVLSPLIAVAARVLPNPPVTPSLLDLLDVDNAVPDNAITQTFGIQPTPFAPEELTYLRAISARDALRSLFTR